VGLWRLPSRYLLGLGVASVQPPPLGAKNSVRTLMETNSSTAVENWNELDNVSAVFVLLCVVVTVLGR